MTYRSSVHSARKVCLVIPARIGSTRLAEKALADIHGKPMIAHVEARAREVRGVDEVLVATDHPRVLEAVERFGGRGVLTPETLLSGTDRVAFVARSRPDDEDIFVNVQGDEPMLNPRTVEASLELVASGRFEMATPAAPLEDEAALRNPNVVKVLVGQDGRAVYFSRHPIPYSRGSVPPSGSQFSCRHHLGVYVYTRQALLRFSNLPPVDWEAAESLEQLRALYYGISIGISSAERASRGVDTLEDLEFVRRTMLV